MNKKIKGPSLHSIRLGLRSFRRDERGMSTVEYVILLAVIVVGAVATWNEIGTSVKGHLGNAKGDIMKIGN